MKYKVMFMGRIIVASFRFQTESDPDSYVRENFKHWLKYEYKIEKL